MLGKIQGKRDPGRRRTLFLKKPETMVIKIYNFIIPGWCQQNHNN